MRSSTRATRSAPAAAPASRARRVPAMRPARGAAGRVAQRAPTGTAIALPPLSSYAPRLWDYWERNLDPDLFRERSLTSSIKGKRVLITGASSGIGLETALKVGEAGGEVILVSRTR